MTTAHTGDPPPRGICASDSGGPRPTKVKLRSSTQCWPQKQEYCACSSLWKRRLLRRLGSPILRHRSSRLHLTGLDYACAETDIGEILLRMLGSPSQSTESEHRSGRLRLTGLDHACAEKTEEESYCACSSRHLRVQRVDTGQVVFI